VRRLLRPLQSPDQEEAGAGGDEGFEQEFPNLFQFDKLTDLALGALGRVQGGRDK